MRKINLIVALAAVWLGGCTHQTSDTMVFNDLILGLASPFRLPPTGPATLHLGDYVLDSTKLDSFSIDAPFQATLADSGFQLNLTWNTDPQPISQLRLWSGGVASTVLLLRSEKQNVEVVYNGAADSVRLAGEFTGWVPQGEFAKMGNEWKATFALDPGQYQYQMVVNGKWMLDPTKADSIDNNAGGFNSLLVVNGPDNDKCPLLLTRDFVDGTLKVSMAGGPATIIALWENHVLPAAQVVQNGDSVMIQIPEAAKSMERTDLRVFAYNATGTGNDLLIPLINGAPITATSQLPRTDYRTAQMYFMMVDRFVNGDTTNDQPVPDPAIHPKANYQGGDLAGVLKVLGSGYFDSLHVNTLWVSPITQNPLKGHVEYPEPHRKYSGYHGYWPVANTRVDHRFGNDVVLKSMVDAIHGSGRNIILDFVSNHVHEDHPMVKQHPEWRTPLNLPDGRKNIRLWDEYRLTTWFDTFIPSLDHAVPEVTNMLCDTALLWVRDKGFDGFRHDAAKHIPQEFWRELTKRVKKQVVLGQHRPVLQIGETFGSRELIGSYIGSGMMDGKFDFNLYFDARSVFAVDAENFDRLAVSLQSSLRYFGAHHLMGNITGNHDLPRFISYASGALTFGEDEKEAGWNRDIQVIDTVGHLKLRQITAFMWTIPGIPVMYYGDEFGMAGAGDPDNRRMMRFDLNPNERATLRAARKLASLRKQHSALVYGDLHSLKTDGRTLQFMRSYMSDEVAVLFNKDSVAHTMVVDGQGWKAQFGSAVQASGTTTQVNLKPYGFEVLIKQ